MARQTEGAPVRGLRAHPLTDDGRQLGAPMPIPTLGLFHTQGNNFHDKTRVSPVEVTAVRSMSTAAWVVWIEELRLKHCPLISGPLPVLFG